ncbi:stage II sporulation protein M [Pelagibius litoralis]|uniref:Stage II sporulation protein M n=1 Tax=Pelagibius litoralis TaxID=374515 RepID=A0A967F2Q2_9PROT|nr:stage II sporulation protein M [Pelagibius litoralis]NIA71815.1 stage II sporulation protein M [Pelagibius litoralis]
MPAPLKSFEFRREREASWRELEGLVGTAEKKGLKSLPAEQLLRLPSLYRAALSSLSVARSISLDQNVVGYLESLCARAYFQVYGSRSNFFESVGQFFAESFPAAVRGAFWPIVIAGFWMALGSAIGFFLVQNAPDWFYSFVPADLAGGRTPASATESLRNALYDGADTAERLYVFATFLFTHNSKVALMAFALGFALGVPTILLMFYNGLVLGAFLALYDDRGLLGELGAWLSVHGTTEILAIILCGGAGLVLARAIIFPDQNSRLDSLARRGRAAGTLAVGGVVMLLVAGLLEGFVRQLVTDVATRYAIGGLMLAFWLAYFTFSGRGRGYGDD